MGENIQQNLPREKPGHTYTPLEEVLEKEDKVICDLSIESDGEMDFYGRTIRPLSRFIDLQSDAVLKQIGFLDFFLNVLRHSKTIVLSGVTLENRTMINLLKTKIDFLTIEEERASRNKSRKGTGGQHNLESERELLKEVYRLFRELGAQTKGKHFVPQQQVAYDFIERMVLSVASKTGAKIDTGKRYNPEREKNVRDFHTDEQIVATALCLSIFENKSVAILTRDRDIKRILFNTLSYVSYLGRKEYTEMMKSSARRGIKLYRTGRIGEANLAYDIKEFNPSEKRKEISPKKIREIFSATQPYNPFVQISP